MQKPNTSITSTDSFRHRAQRSEIHRLVTWASLLAAMMIVTYVRRAMGGIVMSSDAAFYPVEFVLLAALVYQLALMAITSRASASGKLLSDKTWIISAAVDVAVPASVLTLLCMFSPRGADAAISGPSMLLFPMVILQSIMRLKPRFTLLTGIAAGVIHWGLVIYAVTISGTDVSRYPVMLTYGMILIFLGVGGWVVAMAMRSHVLHAAAEAEERSRAERERDLLSHDLDVARDIQRSLLPKKAPSIPGFRVAGWSQAADQTGGDYFDWMLLPDGRVIFVIADAAGHGIGPAMLISACRAYLRASSSRPEASSESVLTEVNALLLEDMPPGRFVTAALLVLDPATATGQLYSAGHAPLLFYSAATKTVQSWDAEEMPLGLDKDFGTMKSRRITFAKGDVLMLITDGFFEWPNAKDELFGMDRTEQSLITHAGDEPQTIIDHLHQDVRTFAAGSPQRDDLTAVVLRFDGPEAAREKSAA